jgi:hypothetical protein
MIAADFAGYFFMPSLRSVWQAGLQAKRTVPCTDWTHFYEVHAWPPIDKATSKCRKVPRPIKKAFIVFSIPPSLLAIGQPRPQMS